MVFRRPLAVFFLAVPLIVCAHFARGDVLYRPSDKPPKLTYQEAGTYFKGCGSQAYRTTIVTTRIQDDGFELIRKDQSRYRVYHRDMSDPYVSEKSMWTRNLNSDERYYMETDGVGSGRGIMYTFVREQDEVARRCADALYVLRRGIPPESSQAVDEFRLTVEKFRAAGAAPEFPEEARRARIQAESALREKRTEDAVDRYEEALKIAPWWPEGRFNRALVLGDLDRYTEAIREMKKYLALVPDAPNARAAQDKIYEWEDKVSRK